MTTLLRIRPGLVGIVALVLLGLGAWSAWGRSPRQRNEAQRELEQPAAIPPIDARTPPELSTATFSLG
ncbi:MAG: hypothetical protein GXY68_06230 [Chloroflexi bacterium]|mgnify:CR=1 FL=1|jgi:hypothetical protein|nr:hypothetical protein [Chloroflexota bacterium]